MRFGIAKVVRTVAKKDCIIRTGTDIQAAKEPDRGIGSVKLGYVATASLREVTGE